MIIFKFIFLFLFLFVLIGKTWTLIEPEVEAEVVVYGSGLYALMIASFLMYLSS